MTAASPRRYLMCAPTHFAVSYRINPWMHPDEPVDAGRAVQQWSAVRAALTGAGHEVLELDPQPELPDLVFTANGATVIGDRALVARFRHPQRAAESVLIAAALQNLGLEVAQAANVNEGEGDFRLVGDVLLAGVGMRSETSAVAEVADFFGLPVMPLVLTDPRFYHLDTALAALDDRTLVYLPDALDPPSRGMLRDLFPGSIVATEADGAALGVNMISDGRRVVMSSDCPDLAERIGERGYEVVAVPLDELRKSGGGAKCCVLEFHDERAATHEAHKAHKAPDATAGVEATPAIA